MLYHTCRGTNIPISPYVFILKGMNLKPGKHLSAIPGWVALSQLGALVWMALRAEENRFGSPLDLIYWLSVHESETPPSSVTRMWDLHSCSPIPFCIDRLSQLEAAWPPLVLRCIPAFRHLNNHYPFRICFSGSIVPTKWRSWAKSNWLSG